jgi:hypothetical protein
MSVLTFEHTFKGITTGVSTKQEVVRLLGFPRWKLLWWPVRKLLIWWEPNPRHKGVEIRLSEDDGKVEGIAVRIVGYSDINAIKVGGPWTQIDHLAVTRAGSGWAVDEARGIIYTSVTHRREVDAILLLRTWPPPNKSLERMLDR